MTQHDFSRKLNVAVIVPYFQRKAGILRRCLASIFNQHLNEPIGMHVIIIDDTSPWPAKEELRNTDIPEHITIDVITRGSNGGPAAARNTGLDHVLCEMDFVAFVDSDDIWRSSHMQRAVDALGSSNDVYFSDHLQWGDFSYFDAKKFSAVLNNSSTSRSLVTMKGVWVLSNVDIFPYAVKEFIAHTSTIVYRRSALSTCRFDGELRWGGEDDLFLLDLLVCSTQTCVSAEVEVELGFGENIFLNSWSWDSENNFKRLVCQLLAQHRIRRRYHLSSELYEMVTWRIRNWSLALAFFIARQLLKGRTVPLSLLLSLVREDPLFLIAFPIYILRAAHKWALGKLQGTEVFNGGKISR